ncbi:hypothetical protein ACIBBB_04660 [Streptomyces sp. NPDC051217]|uniref:hypothetical protein n=1 Tax=Streptomyces sp. NPDC051217 TaxID=3365644 RepID=UPI0037AD4CE6
MSDAALTLGMVMVLFAVYLLWWTNHAAQARARSEVERLEQRWGHPGEPGPDRATGSEGAPGSGQEPNARGRRADDGRDATAAGSSQRRRPASSQTFAVLRIPRSGLTAPIAEGVDEYLVLDRGFVGHYPGAAMPGRYLTLTTCTPEYTSRYRLVVWGRLLEN